MKLKFLFMTLILFVFIIAGCGATPLASPSPTLKPTATPILSATPALSPSPSATATDVVTTASIVNDNAAFEKAISKTGVWIICTLKDLTFTTDLVLDGEYKNGKKDTAGADIIQRKIGLYTQDADRKVTNRYSLTAPKLTINSPNASIERGTFNGDLYVAANNFKLIDQTVNGNVYFSTDAIKSSFTADTTSKITGEQKVK